ncbi:hypothetical protein CUMW_133220 [Citrus unshiu]|nr:hypothetical protein CUMW_133220 [Citrus unshiu]
MKTRVLEADQKSVKAVTSAGSCWSLSSTILDTRTFLEWILFLAQQQGTSVGLVGKSGCGKSTVIGLIQRFYDVERG